MQRRMKMPTKNGCSSAKPKKPMKNFHMAEKKPPADIVSVKSNITYIY